MQECFDIAMTEPLGSTDRVARQSAAPYHTINRHFGDLQHPGKLTYRIELGLGDCGILPHYKHLPTLYFIGASTN